MLDARANRREVIFQTLDKTSKPGASIAGDENILTTIETRIVEGRLMIRPTQSYTSKNSLVVHVSGTQINRYGGSGASKGLISNLNTHSLEVELSGASSLEIREGTASEIQVDVSGASSFQAPDLVAQQANVEASGASSILVHAVKALDADASGASNV